MKKGIALLFLLSGMAHAQVMDEVITLKDGTVLQGEIVEQSFVRGTYTVQLNSGGSVEVNKKQVKGISRVKSLRPPRQKQVQHQSYVSEINALPATSAGPTSDSYEKYPAHALRVGSMIRSFTRSNGYGTAYFGYAASYQFNLTNDFGLYSSYFDTKLRVRTNSEGTDIVSGDTSEIKGAQLVMIFANKFTSGWNFFGGLGVFKDFLTDADGYKFDYQGLGFHAGLGYNWRPFELTYRMSYDRSSDLSDVTVTNGSFQLGFTF